MSSDLLQRAGEALRRLPDEVPSAAAYAGQRATLVQAAQRELSVKRDRGVRVRRLGLVLSLITILLGLGAVLRARFGADSERELSFQVGTDATPGKLGQYYAAADATLPLRFADGSTITLSPGARARVPEAGASRRVVLLETGAAGFHVVHAAGVSWNLSAGPYTVHVTGTEFRLGWDDAAQELSLDMHSGAVLVSGPGIAGQRRVEGTQRLRARAGFSELLDEQPAARAERDAARESTQPAEPAATPAVSGSVALAHSAAPDAARSEPFAQKESESWAALFARGRYHEVVEAARRRGVEGVLATASAQELRVLADAARFSAEPVLARRALLSLRARHPGTEPAIAAAFLLGRMADEGGDPQTALQYYDRYLAEGWELAPEALGRRMLTLQRLGERDESRRAAQQYLRRFPTGPYAKKAESLSR